MRVAVVASAQIFGGFQNLPPLQSLDFPAFFGLSYLFPPRLSISVIFDTDLVTSQLLLIIPGIMASYSYAMTGYILAEHPELTASEAIAQSKDMMAGNRWRLFCLQFSFIGWDILCALTLGIGNLALRPYRHAAEAAFYRELCGGTVPEDEEYSV